MSPKVKYVEIDSHLRNIWLSTLCLSQASMFPEFREWNRNEPFRFPWFIRPPWILQLSEGCGYSADNIVPVSAHLLRGKLWSMTNPTSAVPSFREYESGHV